ncbi:sortase [Knoellia aerolata DSM 18566]|uniref:Sortase n=1 Tax=Knoellia aerolata DSM 18566 TaxID=1385519 RepID=A0A0A0K001_9MICO|nr:sortase [Knoellia aerolata DSM 18566]
MTLGGLVLLFVVWQVWWTDVESDRAHAQTVSTLEREFREASGDVGDAAAADAEVKVGGDAFAVVRIPRFGSDYARPLVEGTSAKELARGLGHYVGTAGPGEVGNLAIAGHRTTYGKPLADIDQLRQGDEVIVATAGGESVYAVTSHEIVRPSESDVIAPVPGDPAAAPTKAVLTLTSCHPRFSAKQRWIVHAELVLTRTRDQIALSDNLPAPRVEAS